jgi:hypothetical protein
MLYGGVMATKTTITISAKARAAIEAMRAETPGLTLSDFYDQAVAFWLRFADEATFKPAIRQMSSLNASCERISRQLEAQTHPPPPINPERLGEIVAKQVAETLIPLLAPPKKRGWLSRLSWGD